MSVKETETLIVVTVRSRKKMYRLAMTSQGYLFDRIIAHMQFTLIIDLDHINLNLFHTFVQRQAQRLQLLPSNVEKHASKTEQQTAWTLAIIPLELRLKIYDHLTQGTTVRAVGYRDLHCDAFYFKERGICPILMTCKQFYIEGIEIYFENLTVTIKAACPSEFTGDMSLFGSQHFRDSLKQVEIADEDGDRRIRMGTAFKHAQVQYSSKSAKGGRKGAYYFG